MALLGVSLDAQAQSCQLSYESVVNDPTIGSAARGLELDSTTPTLTEDAWALNDIDFDGNCDCTLTVYSKTSLAGCSVTKAISSTTSEHVDVVGGIWRRSADPSSFTVTCNFDSEEQEEEIGMPEEEEEEETQEADLPYDFRALTAEEAADPIAVYIFNNAPALGIQLVDVPAGYHLNGSNTLSGIAIDSWTGNKVYLVISYLSGNNGETAKLYTIMGSGMNADYTTNGVYMVGAELH